MSHLNAESPDPRLIRHALEKLRGRDGLTAARLLTSQNADAAALLELGAVRRYAAVYNVDHPRAAVEVIKECVRDDLQDSHRIVADAILGLGAFADKYANQHVDARVIAALSSNLLGRRRQTLLSHWGQLHQALGLIWTDLPSDRALRGTVEPAMLASLAEQLIQREVFSFGARNAPIPTAAEDSSLSESDITSGRVIIVGGAVMDVKFRTKTPPQVNMAIEARSFSLVPGGKGLNQAIAAARLGLKTSLVAAVASDWFGDKIVSFLHQEGVDTSLLKRVDNATTPFTAVIELELGESAAVYWRDRKARLEISDVERISDQISACDAVLMTFELPRGTLEAALRVVSQREGKRPIVIVTPGQPYDTTISGQSLSVIDYLVAREPELGQYLPPDRELFDPDVAARVLLTQGVETLFVTNSSGCSVYSQSLGSFPVPTFPSPYREAAVARDAFCAALAARLIERDGHFSEEVALWATAAMAAATADHPMPNPMPDRRRVQQILDRSRFSVNLRSPGSGNADDPQ